MTVPVEQPVRRITLTVKDICELLGLSNTTVYAMVRKNQLPHIKARGRILFNRDIIEAWTRGEYQQKEVSG